MLVNGCRENGKTARVHSSQIIFHGCKKEKKQSI
jgi:hypothetical protein